MADEEQFEGFILFVIFNKGSKSEHHAPVLVVENGQTIRLFKEGDNPFMYESIRQFHLSYCRVKGILDKEKNLIAVSDIEQLADPIISLWKNTENETQTEVTASDKKEDDE